jgi:hypothetical protein
MQMVLSGEALSMFQAVATNIICTYDTLSISGAQSVSLHNKQKIS